MKHAMRSRSTHISQFMPFGLKVSLFVVVPNIHKTHKTWDFKGLLAKVFDLLLNSGWDTKIVMGAYVINCIVDKDLVSFKYYIERSTMYVKFHFYCLRLIDGIWKDIDQWQEVYLVTIDCKTNAY